MDNNNNNWKNILQEFCQKNWKNNVFPIYQPNRGGGTPHEPQWSCQVNLQLPDGTVLDDHTEGIYFNKKEAEKEAAKGLYQKLTDFLSSNNNKINSPIKTTIEKSSPKISYQSFQNEYLGDNELFSTEQGLILVDLENVPQAKDCIYPSNYQVYYFLSHQHSLYDWVLSNSFPKNIHIEIITSSLKNAADHYLSYKAGELSTKLISKDDPIIILSRDGAGACTKKCLKMNNFTNVNHITNIRDLQQFFNL